MSDELLLASEVMWPCQHKMELYDSLPACPYCEMRELRVESERLVDSYLTLVAENRVLQERIAEMEAKLARSLEALDGAMEVIQSFYDYGYDRRDAERLLRAAGYLKEQGDE